MSDSSYTCKRCGYETNNVYHLKAHLSRKTPCKSLHSNAPMADQLALLINEKIRPFECECCKKKYASRQGLYVHKRTHAECNKDNDITSKIQDMQNEIAHLREIVQTKSSQVSNVTNINNNNTPKITINLRSFGFENISHLETDRLYMTRCVVNKDVIGLLENIHCSNSHPENQNVRIKSTKKELMETYVDGKWIISDQEETLDELLNKGYRILNFFTYKNKAHIVKECDDDEDEYFQMREWLEELYSNTKIRKPLKRKLLILFMNNKALFLEKKTDTDASSDIDD